MVWTTLVADLETPVSAFLKIAGGRPMSFLLESVEGGAVRGALFDHRTGARRGLAHGHGRAEIKPHARAAARTFHALQRAAARRAARRYRRKPDRIAGRAAADGGRHLRLSRLRHGAADGGTAAAQPGPDRDPGRDAGAADVGGRVRCREGYHHSRHAGAAGKAASPPRRRSRGRASACRRSSMRSMPRSRMPRPTSSRAAYGMAVLEYHACRIRADGERRQGIHRRRRHFPGGAVATFRGAVRIAAVRALPRAAPGQSGAVPLFPRIRRVRDRRIEPRNPGAGTRGHGDHPADRRHAAARRRHRTGQGTRGRTAGGSRRSAPST